MWRSTLLALAFLVLCPLAFSQSTTVSGQIQDTPDGQLWFGGTYSFVFRVSPSNPTALYQWNGAPFSSQQTIAGALDGSGHFSQSLPSNTAITPAGSTWDLMVCPLATSPCVTYQSITITGTTQTLNKTPGSIRINMGSPPPNTRAYTDAELVSGVLGQAYYNITDTLLHYCATAPCGWTPIVGSGSGINTYTVATLPSSPATNTLAIVTDGTNQSCTVGGGTYRNMCQWNGSTWIFVSPASAAATIGNAGQVQKTDGSGGHVASNITETGTKVTAGDDFFALKGPNPASYATWYGMRTINPNAWPQGNVTCTATNPALPFTTLNYALYNGDGIMAPGCGAANSMSTPTIVSVTPVLAAGHLNSGYVVNAPTGSTKYCYLDVLSDKAWGLTAASAEACTNVGPASLGSQTMSLISASRSGAVTTYTVTSNAALAAGAKVHISGTSDDPGFGGDFIIDTIPGGGTTFTVKSGMDARNGGGTTATGGTIKYTQGINIVLTQNPANAFQHLIYGNQQGAETFLAFSLPTGLPLGADPGYLTVQDWGSAVSGVAAKPYWVPNTAPVSAVNDALLTTIASGCSSACTGSGTATLTVAPSNSISTTMTFDNWPNAHTADAAAASITTGGGYVYYPYSEIASGNGCYAFSSYVTLTSTVSLGDPWCTRSTVQSSADIRGDLAPNPARQAQPGFALSAQIPILAQSGYPGILTTSGQVHGITVYMPGNNYLGILDTAQASSAMRNVNLAANNPSSDCIGTLLYMAGNVGGAFGGKLENMSYAPGPGTATPGVCDAAAVLTKQNTEFDFDYFSIAERGFGFSVPSFGLKVRLYQGQETQSLATPMFVFGRYESGGVGFNAEILHVTPDTAAEPVAANWSGFGGSLSGSLTITNTGSPSSGMPYVTGKPFFSVKFDAVNNSPTLSGQQLGQNFNMVLTNPTAGFYNSGIFGFGASTAPTSQHADLILAPSNALFTNTLSPVAPTIAVQSGGTIAIGTHTVALDTVYYDGSVYSEGRSSLPQTFTTTSGNQQIGGSNYTVTGAAGYNVYVDGFLANVGTCATPQVTTATFTFTGGTCGQSQPNTPAAGPVKIQGTTVSTQKMFLPPITMPGGPAFGAIIGFNTATNKLACVYSGGDCSPSPSTYVQTFTGDTNGFASNSGSSGPVVLALNTAAGYAVWGNATSSTAAPGYTALTSWPAAAFPTLNQDTTGKSATFTGCNPTLAGSFCIWNGSAWIVCAGNTTSTQLLQESSVGVCGWGAGTATTFQANGTGLSSSATVNFQNSAAFNGLTATFTNPSAGNVQLGFSGTLGNAGLANPATTVNSQTCTLGSTCTIPFQTNTVNNTSQAGINLKPSTVNTDGLTVTPTNTGTNVDTFEITGILKQAYGGTNQDSSAATGVAQVNSGTWSFSTGLANGTTATTQTVGDNSTKVATDAFVIANAVGFVNPMTTIGDMIGGGTSGTPTRMPAGYTGQAVIATTSALPSFASPVLTDSANSPVSTTPYTIACDNVGTATIDRGHTVRFQSGAAAVTVPLSSAAGCPGLVTTVENDGAGTLTFSRTGSDTFTILDGGTATDGATSFTMATGQYATLKQGATSLWELEIKKTAGVTSIATTSPITGGTITTTGTIACATCVTSTGSLTSTAIVTGAGGQASQTPNGSSTLDASGNMSLAGTLGVTGLSTLTGGITTPFNGVASTAAVTLTGLPYAAGTTTTNVPLVFFNPGATTVTTWSANGTQFGMNASPTFTGNFMDFRKNGGSSLFSVNYQGNGLFAGTLGVTGHVTVEGVTSTGASGTGNFIFGSGLKGTDTAIVTGGTISGQGSPIFVDANGGVASSKNRLDCSQFTGTTDAEKIQNCLIALQGVNAQAGIADATGLSGLTWDANPFAASSLPASGELWLPPGDTVISVPVVMPSAWVMKGIGGRSVTGSLGSNLQVSGSWPATYSTGTITKGTAGASDVITGSGTTWNSTNTPVGCAFVGGTQPNVTYGIISAIGSTTSITLKWGTDNGTGAGAASAYKVFCPAVVMGQGGASAAGAMFGIQVRNLGVDCNNIAGCVPILNWYAQEQSGVSSMALRGFTNIGLEIEGQAQNSGPYDGINFSPGSSCTANTIEAVIRSSAQPMAPMSNWSMSKGACATAPNLGVDVQTNDLELNGINIGDAVTGIGVGGTGTCPVACANTTRVTNGVHITNARNISSSGTTLVHLYNTNGTEDSTVLTNLAQTGITNLLIDDAVACTSTNARLGMYVINKAGALAYSTDGTAGCVTSAGIPNTTTTNPTTAVGGNACSASATTVTMTGLTTGMTIQFTPTTDVSGSTGWGSTGGLVIDAWPTTNTVNYKICNQTGSSITPAAVTWNLSVK